MTVRKATTKPVEPELHAGNRYCRIARILIVDPDIEIEDLAKRGEMSVSSARYCKEGYLGVVQSLIEAGMLKKPKPVESAAKAETPAK